MKDLLCARICEKIHKKYTMPARNVMEEKKLNLFQGFTQIKQQQQKIVGFIGRMGRDSNQY